VSWSGRCRTWRADEEGVRTVWIAQRSDQFEYRRHGTASLMTVLDTTSGEILTETITRG
jgi:hypothetical protein